MAEDCREFRGFSVSFERLDNATLDWAVSEYATCLLDVFLEQFARSLTGERVVEELTALRNSASQIDSIWSQALGAVLRALQSDSIPVAQHAAAMLLMQRLSTGHPCSWTLQFIEPISLLCDCWLFEACERIEVRSSGPQTDIVTLSQGRIQYHKLVYRPSAGGWSADGPERLRKVASDHGPIIILPARAVTCPCANQLAMHLCADVDAADFGPLDDCLHQMKAWSPDYYRWVCRVVRSVALVEAPQSCLRSASVNESCSMVYISNNHDPLLLGEMLVHEASHQYYFIATRHGPVVDPSDEQQFYSPFASRFRPLERIVLGFHAFANVYLYYSTMLKSGAGRRDFCAEQMAKCYRDLAQVLTVIKETDKLTEIGRALADPLLGALHEP